MIILFDYLVLHLVSKHCMTSALFKKFAFGLETFCKPYLMEVSLSLLDETSYMVFT